MTKNSIVEQMDYGDIDYCISIGLYRCLILLERDMEEKAV